MVKNIERLTKAESIHGSPISKSNIQALHQIITDRNVFEVQCGSASLLSKPMHFFTNNQYKFEFLKDGKICPFCDLPIVGTNRNFIAFYIKKNIIHVYGYFEYDCD